MKLGGYVIMITTLVLILTLIGIDTGLQSTLSYVGINLDTDTSTTTSLDPESSDLWSILFGAGIGIFVLLGATGAILIGLFGKGYDPSLVLAPLVIAVAGAFIVSFVNIFMYVNDIGISWVTNVVAVVLGATMIGFLFSCVDYFAGR